MPLARIGVYEALTRLPTTQAMSDFGPEPGLLYSPKPVMNMS
jgi:hypothetical protein